ncbi:EF-hand domain-containing protein [Streptomyces sp. NBC_00237]|uniref:EF-hand domain-containing protein n=1 Tax=Streptomyces sp. NBC_00237 TaxID=2975687 RepID=UPI002255027F|nr:EF-hand domain-containing protein [Streptomyces sp. NBC_00237]MCX5206345.1 EF-hand domain-containing protein [Streptomyces sp. NBC_00237]
MTSDVIGLKYDRLFDMLDVDVNGVLEEQDFITLARSIARATGVGDGSAKGSLLVRERQRCWALLLAHADANGDGQISRDEFHRAMSGAFGDPTLLEQNLRDGLHAEFAAIDADDDGVATVEQMTAFLVAWGLEHEVARASASGLDLNGDGHITREEYVAGWSDFLLEEDVEGAGSTLLGAVG